LAWQDFKSKGVSYYLRLKSLSVTCSYGHPRQGSGQQRICVGVGNNSKTKDIWYPTATRLTDSHGHRSRVIILLSRTFNCGALAPQHQEPEVDPQFPDYVESSTPSQAMLYHRYTQAGSMALPWQHSACPRPNLLRR
jgi:hypothetical protein